MRRGLHLILSEWMFVEGVGVAKAIVFVGFHSVCSKFRLIVNFMPTASAI